MKKLLLLSLLAAALSSCAALGALGAVSSLGNGISTSGDKVILEGTQDLTIAADAYTGVATLITAAVDHHAFNAGQLAQIRSLNDQAIKLLKGGNSGLTIAQRSAGLMLIVTQLESIRKGGQ